MGFFESLFYTIWRGVAIGILISAPMGPVGILCIQRTLYKGRKTGLYTGIGAAISDLFYCILTGFGLSFIEEFLERNQNVIQLFGSAVLIAFAIYLFKKNPASSLRTPQEESTPLSPHKDILGGFFFTFSNPLILFLIIGLFARFNFLVPELSFYYYIAGYAAIFVGAVLWWYFVTFAVNKLRAHFNLRSMWLINRIIGGIILLFALVGIITGVSNLAGAQTINWNKSAGYMPFTYATDEGVLIDNPTDSLRYDYYSLDLFGSQSNPFLSTHEKTSVAKEMELKFRLKNIHGNPSKKYFYTNSNGEKIGIKNPMWGFFLVGSNDTVTFSFENVEISKPIESVSALRCVVYDFPLRNKRIEDIEADRLNPYDGENLFLTTLKNGNLILSGGSTSITPILKVPFASDIRGFGFYAGWGGKIIVSDIRLDTPLQENFQSEEFNIEKLDEYLKGSNDELEGYWVVYDRELEESLLKLGGDYTLACIKRGDRYHMLYLEGAGVNSGNWNKGDIKAVLTPTHFKGVYDLEWKDSMKDTLSKDIKAQEGDGNTLIIQFPYQTSKLRLRKIPI